MSDELLWHNARAVLGELTGPLSALGLVRATATRGAAVLRHLLTPEGATFVPRAVVLEVHLSPQRAAGPLVIAGLTAFRQPMLRMAAERSFRDDPDLDVWLQHGDVLDPRRIRLSRWVRPTTFAGRLWIQAWPLGQWVDGTAITHAVRQWWAEAEVPRRPAMG